MNGLPTQDSLQTTGNAWPISSGPDENHLPRPNLFQELDVNSSVDAFPGFFSRTPDSPGHVTDLAAFDLAGLVNHSSQLAPTRDLATEPQNTQATSHEDAGLADTKDILPPDGLLFDLLDIFFNQHHIFLPFLHKTRYLESVLNFSRENPDRESAALLHAIIAIAATSHDDPAIRNRQSQWFSRAKQLCEDLREKTYPSLQAVQAGLCICILGWTTGNYHLSWLYIGTSWRQAVTLGLNRIDGEQDKVVKNSEPKSDIEVEERRRTIWTLLMLDRGMAFPAGWPHAIDDRQFMVNLPVPEKIFQDADEQVRLNQLSETFSLTFVRRHPR